MRPQEKAIELINKFTYQIGKADKYNYCLDSHILYIAQECALISIDEILSLLPLVNREYWQEVKLEIEKI